MIYWHLKRKEMHLFTFTQFTEWDRTFHKIDNKYESALHNIYKHLNKLNTNTSNRFEHFFEEKKMIQHLTFELTFKIKNILTKIRY